MHETLTRLTITQSELFADWPAEAINKLIQSAEVQVVEPGTCVFRAGEGASHLCLIASGSMSLSREMPSGRSIIARMHLAGEFHGLGPVMAQGHYIYTASCKERSVLVRIAAQRLRQLVAANGQLSFSLFAALERRFNVALDLHATAALSSTQSRIASLLRSIDSRSARGGASAPINLSHDEIATMVGTRRQVVSRVLRTMEESGAILLQYGRISIVDAGLLEGMALEANADGDSGG